ncbi:MAG: putative peptidoglycan glycosyltransferase FtsW [Patescibacteria group bacterium]
MATPFTKGGHRPDPFLIAVLVILVTLGLVILASASSELGKLKFGDSYYYLKHQLMNGASIGIVGFAVAYFIRYQRYRKIALIGLAANIVFLALVFTPLGLVAGGASRWLRFGPMSFQPAELLKLTYIVYLAAWLTNAKFNRRTILQGIVPFLCVSGVIAGLLLAQPATSTVFILLASGITVYFVSGAPLKHLTLVALGGIAIFVLIVWSTPYRAARILTFLDPSRDTQGSSYQINQSLIAIGSGRLTGLGYGASTSKARGLPAPLDDSIFAVAAQELGFAGAGALVMLFALLVYRMLWLARGRRDRFGQLILVGFATIIGLQSIVNMGAVSGLLPLTGVPLPFVSYGGTALAVFMTMGGVAVNISKYT